MIRVRLVRKLAQVLNGVDLSKCAIGDVILVPEAVAAMLIREEWAERVPDPPTGPFPPNKAMRKNVC